MSPKPIQTLIIAVPIAIFGWLSWQFLVPTGVFRASWQPGERSAFIDPIRPDQRVALPTTTPDPSFGKEGTSQEIIGDPVYTFVHPSRHFDAVDITFTFRDQGVPIVEAGGLIKSGPDEVYDLQPLENDLIDRSTWKRVDENGLVLLQRNPTYASIADFLARPPEGKRVASYRFDGVLPGGTSRLLPSLDLAGIDYVIARYQTPQDAGSGWRRATVRVDPSRVLMQHGAWKVAISAPGASAATPLLINRINVHMVRPNLLETLKSL